MFKREVLGWNKGRRVVVLRPGHGRKAAEACQGDPLIWMFTHSLFFTGNELFLSSASLAVSMFRVSVPDVPTSACEEESAHMCVSVSIFFFCVQTCRSVWK